MRRLLALMLGVLGMLAAIGLSGSPARADTLADCLGQHHVCVTSDGRSLVSQSQQAQLERAIGNDDIYLVAAASGSAGYDAAMRQIIGTLGSEKKQFVVGFLDSRLRHFGADNRGVLEAGAAANIATTVVQQHQSDQDVFAALQDFVRDVQQEAKDPGSSGAAAGPPSHTLRNVLIVLGVILLVVVLGGLFIWRPRRLRRQRDLAEAKAAAQDDLLALSNRITDHQNDVSVQSNPEAAAEQAAALAAYERGTAAWTRPGAPVTCRPSAGTSPRASTAWPAPKPSRTASPSPGGARCASSMSVTDVSWAPPDGGPSRMVPVCAMDLRKVDQGIQPEIRRVEDTAGARVPYVNSGFAPAYWGGFGYGGAALGGFLLGEALASPPIFINEYGYGDPGYGNGGDNFGGGDFGGDGGNDFGGGDFGGGDYGGGDMGGGDFGGGDFGGGGGDF